ncbi:cAMP-responsive element modulator-like isoform X2 [Cheilinus undulatus]|uniref:cAMP-responsive element modulator-like isoform X2 n=1 Tax=Cheilinus undulatus TaxID=241271 RepID=UPI001BD537BA|nr:cAMP-responsive element modulator-like isoform X2 [Cheilinus undulatus]
MYQFVNNFVNFNNRSSCRNSATGGNCQCADQLHMAARMYGMSSDGKYRPHVPIPVIPTPVHQKTSHNQAYFGSSQGGPINMVSWGTQNLSTVNMTCTQASQPLSSTFQSYSELMNSTQHGYTQSPSGTAGDLTACQLRNPSSSLPQGVECASAHSSQTPVGDALQKRELRLMKNREAARECRRKKKEYVKCLENRVAVLENQNKTLIEELRALKDIYRHKVE